MADSGATYWRLRMSGPGWDLGIKAWKQGVLGVWHGNYSVAEFREAETRENSSKYLTELNKRNGTDWDVSMGSVRTVKRFLDEVKSKDWVLIYIDGELNLARLSSEAESDDTNRYGLNGGDGDRLKYRKIVDRKCFQPARLPDCFLLLRTVGRATFQRFDQGREHAEILAGSKDENDVVQKIKNMPLGQWLDIMGPSGWESVCEAYLILTRGFVPTGLQVGKTLPDLDIVGKRIDAGTRVVAQCKKNRTQESAAEEFLQYVSRARAAGEHSMEAHYFGYGGCKLTAAHESLGIRTHDRGSILSWLENDSLGARYRRLLLEWT